MKPTDRQAKQRILLVHPERMGMGDATRRAEALAMLLGAELTLVKLSRSGGLHTNVIFPQANVADGLERLRRARREARSLARWAAWREKRGDPCIDVVLCPPGVEALIDVCSQEGVALLVVPGALGWNGHTVGRLATGAGVPVLLARPVRGSDGLVVASNLEDPKRPVIRAAIALAARVEATLTVVHNEELAMPGIVSAGVAAGMAFQPIDDRALARGKQEALSCELAAMGHPGPVRVTQRFDPVEGILDTARGADADLIIVGVRERSAPGLFATHVAERVCATARGSVLLMPV